METIVSLVKRLWEPYAALGDKWADPIRGAGRVEIPSAFALAALRFGLTEHEPLARELCLEIIRAQEPSGAWLEYPYAEGEPKVGYAGTVPTAFAVIALAAGYQKFQDASFLESVRRGAEYLSGHERGGYFLKTPFNKSDVVNTNLLASLAVSRYADLLPADSGVRNSIGFLANRTVRRAISSQLLAGGLPYISFGLRISYLYHAMATALLGSHLRVVSSPIVRISFERSAAFLEEICRGGRFIWARADLKDKEGAVWAYGWAALAAALQHRIDLESASVERLYQLRGEKFLRSGDFDLREDLFYTAWTLFALGLLLEDGSTGSPQAGATLPLVTPADRRSYWWLQFASLWPRARYAWRIWSRRHLHKSLDPGSAEEQ
ncbi:MAG: hypothetical protein HY978_03025 [Candidatus Liptonbacteria bacterium]|nr:hypothetical protein [Candidatus Liptonbacteria bacterium]